MSERADAWRRGQGLAAGQVAEFKVWAELIRQSGGDLHVFLPVRDRGIDGVLHRLSDGAYIPIQVKGRSSLTPSGQVHITVPESSLVDDEAFIVGTLIDGPDLGALVLVVREADFRRLASHDWVGEREYLTAAFQLHTGGDSRWAPFLVPRDRLAEPFTTAAAAALAEVAEEFVDRPSEGLVGETEVVRQLADTSRLALFRPFPDLETVEVLARHVDSRRFMGLQVKTAGWDPAHVETRFYIRRASFRAAHSTFICVLGWNREAHDFEADCLVIPSVDIAALARVHGEWMEVELEPGSSTHRRLDRYRTALATLGAVIEAKLA